MFQLIFAFAGDLEKEKSHSSPRSHEAVINEKLKPLSTLFEGGFYSFFCSYLSVDMLCIFADDLIKEITALINAIKQRVR